MYVNLKLLGRACYIQFFERPPLLRRWFWTLAIGVVFGAILCFVAIGRLLDHIFFPRFAKQVVRNPIFVIGTPRSGTTLTQNLLCLDADRFAYFRLYQTIFPSVLHQRMFDALAKLDARLGGALSRLAARIERRYFGSWGDMHPLVFDRPEEDEGLFVYTIMTEALYLLFPYVESLPEAGFLDRAPEATRRRVMRYFTSCVRRHLYATGPEKTPLLKSTSHAGRIDSLLAAFPDARFIHLVRNPEHCIPSHVSVFYPAWHAHSPEIAKDSPESRAYGQLAVDWYRNLYDKRQKFDDERYICIRYDDLVADPPGTVARIYAHFGMTLSDAYRAKLQDATKASRRFESRHHYTLEEFGMSKAWIRERLGDVMDSYGFETGSADDSD